MRITPPVKLDHDNILTNKIRSEFEDLLQTYDDGFDPTILSRGKYRSRTTTTK